jgi:hypothetical protein
MSYKTQVLDAYEEIFTTFYAQQINFSNIFPAYEIFTHPSCLDEDRHSGNWLHAAAFTVLHFEKLNDRLVPRFWFTSESAV